MARKDISSQARGRYPNGKVSGLLSTIFTSLAVYVVTNTRAMQNAFNKQEASNCHEKLQPTLSWRFLLDLFTGRYLWNASVAYREQRSQGSANLPVQLNK